MFGILSLLSYCDFLHEAIRFVCYRLILFFS